MKIFDEYKQLVDEIAQLTESLKERRKSLKVVEKELVKHMKDNNLHHHSRDGLKFVLKSSEKVSVEED